MTQPLPKTLDDKHLKVLATLQVKLTALGVDGHFLPTVSEGPIVTLYRFVPQNATRVQLIERLHEDMAVALAVEAVQVKRLPGESAIGIYVPNKEKHPVLFRDSVGEVWKAYNTDKMKIPILFGIDNMGKYMVEDLTTMPHLLVAGSTGSGKSTLINSIIGSLIYTVPPANLKLVMSDVKQVEFTNFVGTPHLMYPVSTSIADSMEQMEWLISEINRRLSSMARRSAQNILQYNNNAQSANQMPYVVLVIDELAEILQDQTKEEYVDADGKTKYRKRGKRAEYLLGLIAQKARATGIHIIAATQRPSVKVVEGNIKANFPARVSFRLPNEADSRTILGTGGAEQLLSQGDMLYLSPNTPAIRRLHSPLASIADIQAAVDMACRRT